MVRAVGCSVLLLLFKTFLFCVGVYLIHNVMRDSGAQQSDSAIHMRVSIFPQLPSHPGCQAAECALCFWAHSHPVSGAGHGGTLPQQVWKGEQQPHCAQSRQGRYKDRLRQAHPDILSWEPKDGARIWGQGSWWQQLSMCPSPESVTLLRSAPMSLYMRHRAEALESPFTIFPGEAFASRLWQISYAFQKTCMKEKLLEILCFWKIYIFYLFTWLITWMNPNPKPFLYVILCMLLFFPPFYESFLTVFFNLLGYGFIFIQPTLIIQ